MYYSSPELSSPRRIEKNFNYLPLSRIPETPEFHSGIPGNSEFHSGDSSMLLEDSEDSDTESQNTSVTVREAATAAASSNDSVSRQLLTGIKLRRENNRIKNQELALLRKQVNEYKSFSYENTARHKESQKQSANEQSSCQSTIGESSRRIITEDPGL